MTHTVCTECHGMSDMPKTCDTADCSREGQPLAECDCTDGQHQSAHAASDQSLAAEQ